MYRIGTIFKLKRSCLGNEINAIGMCYSVDNLLGRPSYGIIFENGEYDGFSKEDIDIFLEKIRDTDFDYNFTNVMKLSRDFDNGIFNNYLK